MTDKILIAIIGILIIMNVSIVIIWSVDNQQKEPEPVEIKSDFQEHQRIYEMIVNNEYWSAKRDCNITKQLFELQTEDSGVVVIGNLTSIDDWHDECVRLADSRKVLTEKELMK